VAAEILCGLGPPDRTATAAAAMRKMATDLTGDEVDDDCNGATAEILWSVWLFYRVLCDLYVAVSFF
jgi:hypothetical protein